MIFFQPMHACRTNQHFFSYHPLSSYYSLTRLSRTRLSRQPAISSDFQIPTPMPYRIHWKMIGYLVDEIEKTRLSRQNVSVRVLYTYCVFGRLSRRIRHLNKNRSFVLN